MLFQDYAVGTPQPKDSVRIEKADNGWMVTVFRTTPPGPARPPGEMAYFKAMANLMPEIAKTMGRSAVEGVEEETETWKPKKKSKSKDLNKIVDEAYAPSLAPPAAPDGPKTYVFTDKVLMLEFLDKELG